MAGQDFHLGGEGNGEVKRLNIMSNVLFKEFLESHLTGAVVTTRSALSEGVGWCQTKSI